MRPDSGTDWICSGLTTWVRLVLRYRQLTIIIFVAAGFASLLYAGQNLGINTDTADMISPDLPWRQDFIAYRERFAVRGRSILIVVDANIPEHADEIAAAVADGLRQFPALYHDVFLAGSGDFFERNGLMYLSVAELETMADRLAAAQPLLGRLQERYDGAQLVQMIGELVERGEESVETRRLYGEFVAALDAAADAQPYTLSWRSLLQGEAAAPARRFVLLRPLQDFTRARPAAEAMEGIRALIEELQAAAYSGVSIRVTGTVAMEHEELSSVTRGAGLAGLVALMMVASVLYVALRSVVVLAICVMTLVVGLSSTAAFAAAVVGHLNLLSVAFAVLYIGLGVDFILHICLRLREVRSDGRQLDTAIVDTVAGVGSSLVICTVTTAAGFYSFIPTAFSGVSELGLISGTGMIISLLVSVTLLPAMLAQFVPVAGVRAAPDLWWGTRLLGPVVERPRAIVGMTVVMILGAVFLLPRVSFDRNPINLRDPNSESVLTLQDLATNGEALPLHMVALAPDSTIANQWITSLEALSTVSNASSLDAMVPGDQQRKLMLLEDMAILLGPRFAEFERQATDPAEFGSALEELNTRLAESRAPAAGAIGIVRSVQRFLVASSMRTADEQRRVLLELESGLLTTLPRQLQRLATGLTAEPFGSDDIPEELTSRWLAADGTHLVEIAPVHDMSDNDAAEEFVRTVRATVSTATGLPVVYEESGRTVVRAFQMAFTYALLMVSIILWVFLRRFAEFVLVIVPVILAAGMTAALTVLLGLQFNFANIIALPLLLGVGVDNGIHIVHRMRTEPPADGHVFNTSTSRAVLASGLTTIASFGNLAFASHLGMASMGQLLTLGMLVTLVATLVLLPALLALRACA